MLLTFGCLIDDKILTDEPCFKSQDNEVRFLKGCQNNPSYMVLKGTYGQKIYKAFRTTRQGVRWRFQRLFSHVYVEAFETILMIEKVFGAELREHAVRISRERYIAREEVLSRGFQNAGDLDKK